MVFWSAGRRQLRQLVAGRRWPGRSCHGWGVGLLGGGHKASAKNSGQVALRARHMPKYRVGLLVHAAMMTMVRDDGYIGRPAHQRLHDGVASSEPGVVICLHSGVPAMRVAAWDTRAL
jgi:hypothetical protein